MFSANSAPMYFNDQPLRNDLVGALSGSVLFAQSSIIPSRASSLPEDIHPHLVALRRTLLLFKPLGTSFNPAHGISVRVLQKGGKDPLLLDLQHPEELPKLAESVDEDEYYFIEPSTYSYQIHSQLELDSMSGDKTGKFLSNILLHHGTVQIKTADGQWICDFYLPEKNPEHNGCLITFISDAGYDSNVHYNGKCFVLKRGNKEVFKNKDGSWEILNDVSPKDAIHQFAEPDSYNKVISSQEEFNDMIDDVSGKHFASLLLDNQNIKVSTGDGRWIQEFYLPKGDCSHDGKVITFVSDAGYSSTVYFSNQQMRLARGETLVFKNKKGAWLEWSEVWYSKIQYGENFWSAVLPGEVVQPGIKLSFENNGQTGSFGSIKIGAPTEVLLHTIDVGMLTPYRNNFVFQTNPKYHTQYFQQIPTSRLVVTEYKAVTLEEIVLPNGTKYTDCSADTGGVYQGDMRQYIGKILISLGINDANYGVNSASGIEERTPYACGQMTGHATVGKYSNGVVVHGLSGGNSIVTLRDTTGNEFSHEMGHNYGVGHYPNGFEGSVHRSSDHINSTWGWDSVDNVFLPNFSKRITGYSSSYGGKSQAPFNGHSFGYDAMAGGEPFCNRMNSFTLHTPYTSYVIQQFLESKVSFDQTSKTGWSKWSEESLCMEPWAEVVDAMPNDCAVEASMHSLLTKHKLVNISFYDGYWSHDILVPNASSELKGKGIHIDHSATFQTLLRINEQNINVKTGDVLTFETADSYECDLQSMAGDTEGKYLTAILSDHPAVRIQTWDGHWLGKFYLPADNPSLDRCLVGFCSWASYNSTIYHNGEKHALIYGSKASFENVKGKWNLVKYDEEDFFYWKKVDDLSFDVVRNSRGVIKCGGPVVTILGYYDPLAELESYIYPAFYGAYGYTFESNSANEIKACKCYAAIFNAKEQSIMCVLKGRRMNSGNMNRFQINIPAGFEPKIVSIICNGEVVTQRNIHGPAKKLSYTVNGRPL